MISKNNPNVWERKSGGGCLMMMGLPFFGFGLIGLLAYAGIIPNERVANSPAMSFFVASLCLVIGLIIMFVRTGLTIDKEQMTASDWIGILIPIRKTVYNLKDYNRIELTTKERKFHSTETITLLITIEGDDREPIFIEESSVHEKSRQTAKELSEFLNLKIQEQANR